MTDLSSTSVLIVGFARTGQAVAKSLIDRVREIRAIDDRGDAGAIDAAGQLGVELEVSPEQTALQHLVGSADLVVVSPGVPPSHVLFSICDPTKIISEIELAYRLTSTPIVAITGTNGKTTVTSLVASMLTKSGIRVRAVGNIGDPLIGVVDDGLDLAVAEVSSFQLAYTREFRPKVGTWLNFSDDHYDWHANRDEYAAAKARIWMHQRDDDVAIANRDDPVVWSATRGIAGQVVSFGAGTGDYRIVDDAFFDGHESLAHTADLQRAFPHDVMNALAALATARSAGATRDGCRDALRAWRPLPHRVEFVASLNDVDYFDDSKATTPSAVIAALEGLSSVVLIAGGRSKGLDLGEISRHVRSAGHPQLRGVVAIGESAPEVIAAFDESVAVKQASSMSEAVSAATGMAEHGDAVLLSPGCASFDWYRSYEERGEDFARCVLALGASRVGKE